jgi:hypothetical protein
MLHLVWPALVSAARLYSDTWSYEEAASIIVTAALDRILRYPDGLPRPAASIVRWVRRALGKEAAKLHRPPELVRWDDALDDVAEDFEQPPGCSAGFWLRLCRFASSLAGAFTSARSGWALVVVLWDPALCVRDTPATSGCGEHLRDATERARDHGCRHPQCDWVDAVVDPFQRRNSASRDKSADHPCLHCRHPTRSYLVAHELRGVPACAHRRECERPIPLRCCCGKGELTGSGDGGGAGYWADYTYRVADRYGMDDVRTRSWRDAALARTKALCRQVAAEVVMKVGAALVDERSAPGGVAQAERAVRGQD